MIEIMFICLGISLTKLINNIDLALNTIKIPIDEVILVGGFCNCEIVIDTITNKYLV